MPLLLIDTNLLLLLIVGRADRALIGRHRRTASYHPADLDILEDLIAGYEGLATLPHILAETSNLLGRAVTPDGVRIREAFHAFVKRSQEIPVRSRDACARDDAVLLGLTDAAILLSCGHVRSARDRLDLLTADEPLYHRALSLGLPAELYA